MSAASDKGVLSQFAAPRDAGRYDSVTIALHWVTAILVILLFALAFTWNNFVRPRTPMRHEMQLLHVSFGLLLTAVFILRLAWRATAGRALPRPMPRGPNMLVQAVRVAIYALLAAQIVFGFLYRWGQGEEFTFFGLFAVPAAFVPDRGLARTFDGLHYYTGWIIIVVAAGHAIAALLHHYVLRDGILRRMLPVHPR